MILLFVPPQPKSHVCFAPGFVPYSGEGFALLLPSKYNPSKEKEFPGTELRCLCML